MFCHKQWRIGEVKGQSHTALIAVVPKYYCASGMIVNNLLLVVNTHSSTYACTHTQEFNLFEV